ncbi:MAG: ABC transporter ATP-binding protein [Bacteroidales bacterium]|nr:ABC transporter ATP-binding protein [Bacteroidales bacterium]
MVSQPLVEVVDVIKSFKDVKAVNGLSFSVREGQFLALLGPNGAGKTTMVEMIEGIQFPDKGDIIIDGKTWHNHEEEIHRIIGLSLQETRFTDKLNVRETLSLFASFYGLGRDRVEEVINLVNLDEKRKSYVVNLSGGQRQRLALGIALLNNPKILLLDEPTTGLDPTARREVWSILKKLKKEANTSLILTTHYMEEAEQLCDYIIIIDHGKILKEGTLDQLLITERGKKILEFTLKEEGIKPEAFPDNNSFNVQWDMDKQKGNLELIKFESQLPKFLNYLHTCGLTLENMEIRKLSLDDLFIDLTGRHIHENE